MIHGFNAPRKPNIDSIPAQEANQRFITERILRRSTMSAKAPAGMVNKKKGREATVDISEILNGEAGTVGVIQGAALSGARTPQPETTVAVHKPRKDSIPAQMEIEMVVIR